MKRECFACRHVLPRHSQTVRESSNPTRGWLVVIAVTLDVTVKDMVGKVELAVTLGAAEPNTLVSLLVSLEAVEKAAAETSVFLEDSGFSVFPADSTVLFVPSPLTTST